MGGFYTDESLLQIAMVTGLLGGGAAWLSGRAIAGTWRPIGHVVGYMLLLGCAVRFVHFAIFEGTLLSLPSYVCDTTFLILTGALSWRITRVNQMVTQYDWLFERADLLNWRARAAPHADDVRNNTSPG